MIPVVGIMVKETGGREVAAAAGRRRRSRVNHAAVIVIAGAGVIVIVAHRLRRLHQLRIGGKRRGEGANSGTGIRIGQRVMMKEMMR